MARSSLRNVGGLVVGIALLATTPATAADKALLSALPILSAPHDRPAPPKDYGVSGLVVKDKKGSSKLEVKASTSEGYCLATRDSNLRLESSTFGTDGDTELWRLVEKDGKATFERTRFEVVDYLYKAWPKSRTSIELRELTRMDGVTVWGFREANGDVVLLARGGTSGREVRPPKTEDEASLQIVSSDCSFGAIRLSAQASTAKIGTIAQLHGTLPPVGEGRARVTPSFVVDGSLAKLTRDPEPVLAVRVRLLE